jgi:hypothetical protein
VFIIRAQLYVLDRPQVVGHKGEPSKTALMQSGLRGVIETGVSDSEIQKAFPERQFTALYWRREGAPTSQVEGEDLQGEFGIGFVELHRPCPDGGMLHSGISLAVKPKEIAHSPGSSQ